jgi:hypothetical protein
VACRRDLGAMKFGLSRTVLPGLTNSSNPPDFGLAVVAALNKRYCWIGHLQA